MQSRSGPCRVVKYAGSSRGFKQFPAFSRAGDRAEPADAKRRNANACGLRRVAASVALLRLRRTINALAGKVHPSGAVPLGDVVQASRAENAFRTGSQRDAF